MGSSGSDAGLRFGGRNGHTASCLERRTIWQVVRTPARIVAVFFRWALPAVALWRGGVSGGSERDGSGFGKIGNASHNPNIQDRTRPPAVAPPGWAEFQHGRRVHAVRRGGDRPGDLSGPGDAGQRRAPQRLLEGAKSRAGIGRENCFGLSFIRAFVIPRVP